MPRCFQLYDKTNPDAGPVVLNQVDDLMRSHFEQPPDLKYYLGGWFDSIGFRLACGKSFEQIREEFEQRVKEEREKGDLNHGVQFYEDLLRINAWLDERYSPNSFYSQFKDKE